MVEKTEVSQRRENLYGELALLVRRKRLEPETSEEVKAAFELNIKMDERRLQNELRNSTVNESSYKKENKDEPIRVSQKKVSSSPSNQGKYETQSLPKIVKPPTKQKRVVNSQAITPEKIKERNLSILLVAGVALLLLAGTVVATTNWYVFNPLFKVLTFLSVSLLFGGMAFIANKVAIPKTAFSFMALSALFLPLTFVSAAFYQLFGWYFSFFGPGRFIFGACIASFFTVFYWLISKKYQSHIFFSLALILSIISVCLVTRAIAPIKEIQLALVLLIMAVSNYFINKSTPRFFGEFTKTYFKPYVLSYHLVALVLFWYQWQGNLVSASFLFIFSLLALQLVKENIANRGTLKNVSLCLLVISYLTLLIGGQNSTHFELMGKQLIMVISLVVYLLSYNVLFKKALFRSLKSNFGISYYFLTNAIFFVFYFVDFSLIYKGSIIIKLSASLILASLGLFIGYLTKNRRTSSLLIVLFYMWLNLQFILLNISGSQGSRSKIITLFLVYLVILSYKRLHKRIITWSVIGGLTTIGALGSSFNELSLTEVTGWNLLGWCLLLAMSLLVKPLGKICQMAVPVALFLAIFPYVMHSQMPVFGLLLVTLGVIGFGEGMEKWQKGSFKQASLLTALFSYGFTLFLLLVSFLTVDLSWLLISVLLVGIGLSYYLASQFKASFLLYGIPLFSFLGILYPLVIINKWQLSTVIYLQVGALVLLGISYLAKNKGYDWFKQGGFTLSILGLLVVSGMVGTENIVGALPPVSFILPLVIMTLLINLTNKIRVQQLYLSIDSLIFFAFLLAVGDYFQIEWVTSSLAWMVTSTLLVIGHFVRGKNRVLILPIGILVSSIMLLNSFLLEVANGRDVDGLFLVLSASQFIYLSYYLGRGKQPVIQQLILGGSLFYYGILLQTLIRPEYGRYFSFIILAIMAISSGFLFSNFTESNKKVRARQVFMGVQSMGTAILYGTSFETILVNCYLLIVVGLLIFKEPLGVRRRFYQSLESGVVLHLFYYLLWQYQEAIGVEFQVGLVTLSLLSVLIVNSRLIWRKSNVLLLGEWLLASVIVSYLLVRALINGGIEPVITAGILILCLIVVGFLAKYKSYFFVGLIGLVCLIFYSSRNFWTTLPWWLYLALSGILLLSIGISTELQRKKQGPSIKQKMTAKWQQLFDNWD